MQNTHVWNVLDGWKRTCGEASSLSWLARPCSLIVCLSGHFLLTRLFSTLLSTCTSSYRNIHKATITTQCFVAVEIVFSVAMPAETELSPHRLPFRKVTLCPYEGYSPTSAVLLICDGIQWSVTLRWKIGPQSCAPKTTTGTQVGGNILNISLWAEVSILCFQNHVILWCLGRRKESRTREEGLPRPREGLSRKRSRKRVLQGREVQGGRPGVLRKYQEESKVRLHRAVHIPFFNHMLTLPFRGKKKVIRQNVTLRWLLSAKFFCCSESVFSDQFLKNVELASNETRHYSICLSVIFNSFNGAS